MAEVFGTPEQREMQRRAHALWTLLKTNRRIMCHGRLLSVSFETPDCVDLVMSLAQLQGSAGFESVPDDAVNLVQKPLHDAGFQTEAAVEWLAGSSAIRFAEKIINSFSLPDGVTLQKVDTNTPNVTLEAMSDMATHCGEWLAMGDFVRGHARPSAFHYLADAQAKPIAMAGCVVHAGRLHYREEEGWWGMVAVDDTWKRKGLTHYVGAQVLRSMRVDHGIEKFSTVVRESQAGFASLIADLGFNPTRNSSIYVQNPSAFATVG